MESTISNYQYTGDGSRRHFQVSERILSESHCRVWIDDELLSPTLWDNYGAVVLLDTAPEAGQEINIYITDTGTFPAEYTTPSTITIVENSIEDINTVADDIANVNTTANNIASVNTTAGSIASVNTTAGSISSVNAVGSNVSNVNTVSNDIANVNTVATNIGDVNIVEDNIANVNTVAANDADVTIVADNIVSVQTAATNIADIQTIATEVQKVIDVANDLNETTSEIDTVANSIANVDEVGSNITNLNKVAAIDTDVTKVANIDTDVTMVADNDANITIVAGNSANINTVAGNNANVTKVANIDENVTTVAGIDTSVTTVAGISGNVTTVATNNANVTTVAGSISSVNTVGSSITNVNTVATNITDVNNFADTYSIGATAPSSPTAGDLWFDETTDIMKVYNGSAWQSAGSSVNGTSERSVYTATASQTTFNATYDSGYVDVYLNGIKLQETVDFTATNGTTVVLTSGANAGDIVDIVAYGTFELVDHYNKTETDNLLSSKQNTLVSGTNIKTINSGSILGSGNLEIIGIPSGVITMWSGSVSSVPAGWYLCDGSNGTPDLRNTFVYGASSDGEVNTTGGSANAVAVSHSHTGSSASAGSHGHTGSTNTTGNHRHTAYMGPHSGGPGNNWESSPYSGSYVDYTEYAGNHSHTLTINSGGSHSHTVTVDSAGESGTNKNLPPYMKLAYIMKG